MWGWIACLHQSYILALKQLLHKVSKIDVGLMLPEFLQISTIDIKLTCPSSGQFVESEQKMLNRLQDLLLRCCSIKGFPKTSSKSTWNLANMPMLRNPSTLLSFKDKSEDGTESPFSLATKAVRSWAMILSVIHQIWRRKMLRCLLLFFSCFFLKWVNPLPVIPRCNLSRQCGSLN